ncbi:MAG: C-GCAxxG-C-C family protein [Bacteroidia bacterium]|nr:C-GCAxxG-C-C family protein [Bacteroidia bacterium]
MKTKQEKAIESFRAGLNCAQATVTAYSDDLNFDNELAARISCGFGGGMGRLQDTCGAVTGAFMVLGIYYCSKFTDNKDRKEATYSAIQKFADRFNSIHSTLNCKSLMNCSLNTEEGKKYIKDNNLHEKVCEKCIADAIMIVDELTSE